MKLCAKRLRGRTVGWRRMLVKGFVQVLRNAGGIVTDFGGNFVHGESDWIVVEADEFDRSFLHLTPEVAVITSMDPV